MESCRQHSAPCFHAFATEGQLKHEIRADERLQFMRGRSVYFRGARQAALFDQVRGWLRTTKLRTIASGRHYTTCNELVFFLKVHKKGSNQNKRSISAIHTLPLGIDCPLQTGYGWFANGGSPRHVPAIANTMRIIRVATKCQAFYRDVADVP